MTRFVQTADDFTRIIELTPELRQRIEATVEHLLTILDAFEGEPDAEDDGSAEPWLGWSSTGATGRFSDLDLEENGDEQEPFCGWTEDDNQANVHRTSNTGPQEWSYHYGFDGSGERKANALLRTIPLASK